MLAWSLLNTSPLQNVLNGHKSSQGQACCGSHEAGTEHERARGLVKGTELRAACLASSVDAHNRVVRLDARARWWNLADGRLGCFQL